MFAAAASEHRAASGGTKRAVCTPTALPAWVTAAQLKHGVRACTRDLPKPVPLLLLIHSSKTKLVPRWHRQLRRASALSSRRRGAGCSPPFPSAPLQLHPAPDFGEAGSEQTMASLLSPAPVFVPQVPPAISAGAFQIPSATCASSLKKTRKHFIGCSGTVGLIELVWHTGVFNTRSRSLAQPARARRSPKPSRGMQSARKAVAQAGSDGNLHTTSPHLCWPTAELSR